uniref:Uncharacterized protein n=1 Tax=Schistosoma japonicum TaxID=6182 RepID=Q5C2Y0_SCHJA|nr:unknown [Schistosoma japonicum]
MLDPTKLLSNLRSKLYLNLEIYLLQKKMQKD